MGKYRYLLTAIFICNLFYAQEEQNAKESKEDIKFGITAGLINSNTRVNFSLPAASMLDLNAINNVGFYLGGIVDIKFSEQFHAQAELNYGSAGESGCIFLPIFAKYYISEEFNVQLGAQFNIATDVGEIKTALRDIENVVRANSNLDDVVSKTGVALAFGAGYDITDNFTAQARFAFEMYNRYNGPLNYSLKVRESTFTLGVVYFF